MTALRLGWPNWITIARIALVFPFAAGLFALPDARGDSMRWGLFALFFLMAVSDFLDGYLARRFQQESRLGRILDPIADKLLVLSAIVILYAHGMSDARHEILHLPGWVAAVAFAKDLTIGIATLAARFTDARIRLQARPVGKWCTTAQLAAVMAMLLWPSLPDALRPLPTILWWAASILAVAATVDYLVHGVTSVRRASV